MLITIKLVYLEPKLGKGVLAKNSPPWFVGCMNFKLMIYRNVTHDSYFINALNYSNWLMNKEIYNEMTGKKKNILL